MEMLKAILIACAVMIVIAFILGFAVALVSQKFHVEEDKRQTEVEALLPGANCGACGNPGCHAYAVKIFEGGSDGSQCTVIKGEAKDKLIQYIKENITNKE